MLNFQLLQRSDLREHSLFICFKKGWYTADRFCKLDRHISTRIKPFMSVKLWLLWPINRINFVWTLDSALVSTFHFQFPLFWLGGAKSTIRKARNQLSPVASLGLPRHESLNNFFCFVQLMANKTKQFKKIRHNSCQSINRNVSTHFWIDLFDQFNSILKLFDAGPPKGMHSFSKEGESWWGDTNVSCQLNFRLFVGCQLNDYEY